MSNSAYTIRVIKGGMTVSRLAVPPQAGGKGEAVTLPAQPGASYQLALTSSNQGPTKIRTRREGADLWISVDGTDPNQPDVVIRGYYDQPTPPTLLGLDAAGEVQTYRLADVSPLASLHGLTEGGPPPSDDGLYLGGKAAASLIDGLSDTALMWGGAAVGGLLIYQSVSGSGSDDTPPIDTIKAYADSPLATAPTVSTYEKAGVQGVTSSNLEAINSAVSTLKSSGIPDVDALRKVVTAYNKILAQADGIASADPAQEALVAADYATLGVKVHLLEKSELAIALLNDVVDVRTASFVDTIKELNDIVTAVDKVQETINGTSSTLTVADFGNLAVGAKEGSIAVTTANLPGVKSALLASKDAVGDARIDHVSEIQTIVTAYDKIIKFADGSATTSTGTLPTVQDYADVRADIGIAKGGVAGASATAADNALKLLGEVVGVKSATDVDSVDELVKIGAAIDHLMALAGMAAAPTSSPDLTIDDLKLLLGDKDMPSIDPAKLPKVWAAIAETVDNGSGVNTRTQIRNLVTDAVSGLSASEALEAIRVWTTTGGTPPSYKTYEAAGVAGVSSSNVDAINSAVQALEPVAVNSVDGINKVVQAYARILDKANGPLPDSTPDVDLTVNDYQAVGTALRSLETPRGLALLNDVIENRPQSAVDSVDAAGLNGIVASVERLIDTIDGGRLGLSLTVADYATLGMTDSAGNVVTASTANFNVAAIQSSLRAAPKTGDAAIDTIGELQAIVSGYEKILSYADGPSVTNQPAAGPQASDYVSVCADIGLAATGALGKDATLADNALRLLNESVGYRFAAGVDTVKEINDIAKAVDHVMALAALTNLDGYTRQLTGADLRLLGLSVSTDELGKKEQFEAFWTSVANTANTGYEVASLSQLQAFYNASLTI
ncbi:hypothetical protein [Sphaerotilus mobilis]|uniref:Uncharacterized protein n=1 Tax=Sphaerotilus mobilis TaxID=47994 RepID=A0A4Q7LCM0_9BURK|nr:hypothetical protein [Sphaerotilus mobilis]RZS52135.1 hypothetical protein EV685_3324 [Sphaerotilus mobilis]